MAGDGCSAGFVLFPIIMIVVLLSILSRALRGTGGYSGGYRYYRRPGMYYALQYLDNRSSSYGTYPSQPYQSYPSGYPSYSAPRPAYREQPPPGIDSAYRTSGYPGYQPPPPAYTGGTGAYGPGYGSGSAPPPAYSSAAPPGYPSSPSGPAPEVPKVACSYCGSLSPATERHCLLCGAPMK